VVRTRSVEAGGQPRRLDLASIEGVIEADEIVIGTGAVVEENVFIGSRTGRARRVIIGDHAFIGRGTRILVPDFRIGDYSKLNAGSFLHGEKPLHIGRNCWIGGNCVLDSNGGLTVDDNVGIGAQSQLWTHIKFGDVVEGCRFNSRRPMHVKKDVWFVGHCIVSPVRVEERSMAMVGSVVTSDMEANHVYAGVPATDMTDRLGPQFAPRTIDQKAASLRELIRKWEDLNPEFRGQLVVSTSPADRVADRTWFDVSTRTYNKRGAGPEVGFLKAHVPLVKFLPEGEAEFVSPPPAGE
jgi:acetyltransferase-like isoleucine patch superfamily enzyme